MTTDIFEELIGRMEKVNFSLRSESRDRIRRAEMSRKRLPNRRCGVCEGHSTVGYCTDRTDGRRRTGLSEDDRSGRAAV